MVSFSTCGVIRSCGVIKMENHLVSTFEISLVSHMMLIVEIKFSAYKQANKQTPKSEDKSLCLAAGATKKEISNR